MVPTALLLTLLLTTSSGHPLYPTLETQSHVSYSFAPESQQPLAAVAALARQLSAAPVNHRSPSAPVPVESASSRAVAEAVLCSIFQCSKSVTSSVSTSANPPVPLHYPQNAAPLARASLATVISPPAPQTAPVPASAPVPFPFVASPPAMASSTMSLPVAAQAPIPAPLATPVLLSEAAPLPVTVPEPLQAGLLSANALTTSATVYNPVANPAAASALTSLSAAVPSLSPPSISLASPLVMPYARPLFEPPPIIPTAATSVVPMAAGVKPQLFETSVLAPIPEFPTLITAPPAAPLVPAYAPFARAYFVGSNKGKKLGKNIKSI
ncbi:unnamed protein product [Enterobius vermicularis]|uniref:Skin secretory protein xP2-like n=1 Tax=Enterobius vermicularis TaxID=51028 RepID=A0A0N4V5V9_ENTVE|nr:unnamed protein product [Enterobius vermicularis]